MSDNGDRELRIVTGMRFDEEVCRAALEAVDHVLCRRQMDPDVGYLIAPGTETFARLCRAQALAEGRDLGEVMRERAVGLHRQHAEVLLLRERVAELERALGR